MKKYSCIIFVFFIFVFTVSALGKKDHADSKTQYDFATGQQVPKKTSKADSVLQIFNKFYYGISDAINNIQKEIQPYSTALFSTMLLLEIVYFGLMTMLGENNNFGAMIKKFLQLGVMTYVFMNFPMLLQMFKNSVVQYASLGTGTTTNYVDNPGLLLFDAQENIINPFINSLRKSMIGEQGSSGWQAFVNTIEDAFQTVWLGILTFILTGLLQFPFIIVAVQLCVANFELQIIGTFFMIISPFMIFSPLSFLSKNSITTILSAVIKLASTVMISTIAMRCFMGLFKADGYAGLDFFFVLFATLCLMAFLAVQAPNLASTIISGMPTMSFSGLVQNMAAAGAAIKAVGSVGKMTAGKVSDIGSHMAAGIRGEHVGKEYQNIMNKAESRVTAAIPAQEKSDNKEAGSLKDTSAEKVNNSQDSASTAKESEQKSAAHITAENNSGN